jgi:predicted MPP superfamily phosphohydrolase
MMHAVFYLRAKVLLPERWSAHLLLISLLILMVIAPFSSFLIEKNGHDLVARGLALIAFNWMGFIFLAFCLSALMWVYGALAWGLNTLASIDPPSFHGKLPAFVMIVLGFAFSLYGFFEARNVRIVSLQIETDKLPPHVGSLKIAQISDVHLGLMNRRERLSNIIGMLQSENPDILVATGDIVDGSVNAIMDLTALFAQIRPRYGKFAITGNHEYYAGLETSIEFLQKSGFSVLRGEAATLSSLINIAGVDDPIVTNPKIEVPLLGSIKNGLFTLYLKHRPVVTEETVGLFDLQLSGHTHRGQIFPFKFVVATQYPLMNGYYDLWHGPKLYTSAGTGAWGPQIRIMAPPEITIIKLINGRKPLTLQGDP